MDSPAIQHQGLSFSLKFNHPNANIIFRSSDGVCFAVHSQNLDVTSSGFPPTTSQADRVPIDLPENSRTLELMFHFVYPKMRLSLASLDFETLAPLADAVEKYQIHTGMEICLMHMTGALPNPSDIFFKNENAIDVLEYALKHGHRELANQAGPMVTMEQIYDRLKQGSVSAELLKTWFAFFYKWTEVARSISTRSPHVPETKISSKSSSDSVAACDWQAHQRGIKASFAGVIGKSCDQSIIVSHIVVPSGAPTCCKTAAQNWKASAIASIASLPPFIPQ